MDFGRSVLEFVFGRYALLFYVTFAFILSVIATFYYIVIFPVAIIFGLLTIVGWRDYAQKKHSVLGNYPLLGRFRFVFESVRPELRQYFWGQTLMNCLTRGIRERWCISVPRT